MRLATCPDCNGSGRVLFGDNGPSKLRDRGPCETCRGDGEVENEEVESEPVP